VTNLRLFIAVSVPALIVLVNLAVTLSSNHRLQHRMDRLEDRMDVRFERIDARFAAIETELSAVRNQIRSVEVGLANLRAEMFEKFLPRTS
jgi:hypothetical protein